MNRLACGHANPELAKLADSVRREHGRDFAIRIGLHSGDVTVGKIGDDLRMDYTAGHAVGLAQRMEQRAAAKAIFLSEATAKAVEGYFSLEGLGEATVKGASEPVRAFSLRGRSSGGHAWRSARRSGCRASLGVGRRWMGSKPRSPGPTQPAKTARMKSALPLTRLAPVLVLVGLAACSDTDLSGGSTDGPMPPVGVDQPVYDFANGCYAIEDASSGRGLASTGDGYAFADGHTAFVLKPSGLGRYLLFDEAKGYLVSDGSSLQRTDRLESDISLVDDTFESRAEWDLEEAEGPGRYRLRHRKSGGYLGQDGVTGASDSLDLALRTTTGCATFPEDDTYSEGDVVPPAFDDGSLYGIVDTHSHILANFGFGGGGIFHGAPFHPLGIEHALMSCEQFHGEGGRKDLFGAGFDAGGSFALDDFIGALVSGELPNFNHATDGWPTFSEWPSGPNSSTHQTQYYKWIERAYLGGLRLIVQHAVSNQIICDLLGNGDFQPIRYSCNDMVAVDRQLDEIRNMQDYIDAQEGGPGEGWFRIATSPTAARDIIAQGKLAVVLGIETSNLFDCALTPPGGGARCTETDVVQRLDEYYDRGVRVVFPVHKYDNAFSAGDGQKGVLELGNLLQTSHFNNFTTDCDDSIPTVFDRGAASFPGLIEARDDYLAPAPNDWSEFFVDPIAELSPILDRFFTPADPEIENHCQNAGMTALGEFLLEQMMDRGMVPEIDHLPRRAYERAFEILEENDYPAAGTHGIDNDGRLYELGGVSKTGFSTCRSDSQSSTVDNGFQDRIARIETAGGFPAIGFGFDLNGFAGAPRPRFGPDSRCNAAQSGPVEYPFTSYSDDVTFSQPRLGDRVLDFNTEGLVHIGLLPELIEDVRGDGVTDAEIEPLFKSAEAYLRMWEKAERRARGRGGM